MTEFGLLAAFLIGIAGGVHCFGMCGGITIALQAAVPKSRSSVPYTIAYHVGRITSYAIAGALAGAVGGIVSHTSSMGIHILSTLSIVLLILLACYIGNWYRGLTVLERAGGTLWRKLQPISKRLIPFPSPFHAVLYGAVWGWLPCGLVYSTLVWSMSSGDWLTGASYMFAFGIGTLPAMLAVSFGASYISPLMQLPITRQITAISLFAYAIFLIFNNIQHIN